MTFDVFAKEHKVIAQAQALVELGVLEPRAATEFQTLLKAYERLFKTVRRMVKLSDNNEAELNKLAKSLNEKNSMLQGLSKNLAKYLSPQVYDSIFSGQQSAELKTSRKKLTVFFSDIKDFTSITADMQPEDLTDMLNTYFSEMSQIAIEYGATIDKFIGDAMLMFFGDPETRGVREDARTCVRMAIAMQRRMADLSEMWLAKGFGRPLAMRIGLNTGFCNVGNFGSDQRMDYTIIGGEVNLASRLEAAADPGGILMSYETYALVKDIVTVEERDSITMKGISRKVRAFAIQNILADLDQERRVLHHESVGLYLYVDMNKLAASHLKDAEQHVALALERLQSALPTKPKALQGKSPTIRSARGRQFHKEITKGIDPDNAI